MIAMKITRRQLRRLINEAMYDPMHGYKGLDQGYRDRLSTVIEDPDAKIEDLKNFHALSDTFSDYKDPRPGMADDSYEGVTSQNREYLMVYANLINLFLPGFINMEEKVIKAVVEFVFLADDVTLHTLVNEEEIENQMGIDAYDFFDMGDESNLTPAEVERVRSIRRDPKRNNVSLYRIYAAHGSYEGTDPFSKLDPSGYGDSQTGYHDGFSEEYQKLTNYRRDSLQVDSDFIRMVRALKGDHQEVVIN